MNKIMTCIDGSNITLDVVEAGVWAAKKLSKPLHFVHTIERSQQHGADDYSGALKLGAHTDLLEKMTQLDAQKGKLALEFAHGLIDTVTAQAKEKGALEVDSSLRHGDIIEALGDFEQQTRLIVIGRKGKSHEGDFQALGSHIETLLRKAQQPVLIVPERFKTPTSFMIAYDGREAADRALQKVIDGGLLHGIDCHLVTVKSAQAKLQEKFDNAKQRLVEAGLKVTSTFLEGDIQQALVDYKVENNIGLVVMGAFGHSRLRQLFVGSNTLRMIENTDVPIVVLR